MIFMHYFLLPARICCCKFYNNLTGKGICAYACQPESTVYYVFMTLLSACQTTTTSFSPPHNNIVSIITYTLSVVHGDFDKVTPTKF